MMQLLSGLYFFFSLIRTIIYLFQVVGTLENYPEDAVAIVTDSLQVRVTCSVHTKMGFYAC